MLPPWSLRFVGYRGRIGIISMGGGFIRKETAVEVVKGGKLHELLLPVTFYWVPKLLLPNRITCAQVVGCLLCRSCC